MNNEQTGSSRKTRFMSNIYKTTSERTIEIKFLKYLNVEEPVQYFRLIISLLLFAAVAIFTVVSLTSNTNRIKYIAIPIIVLDIIFIRIISQYLLSYHSESLLIVTMRSLFDSFAGKTIGSTKFDFNIDFIKNGIIKFKDNKYGVVYDVKGLLSGSALNSAFDRCYNSKKNYLVSREDSTITVDIIEFEKINLNKQLDHYNKISDLVNNNDNEHVKNQLQPLIDLQLQTLDSVLDDNEIALSQIKFIIESSPTQLQKACAKFELNGADSMYSQYRRLDTNEIESKLKSLNLEGDLYV